MGFARHDGIDYFVIAFQKRPSMDANAGWNDGGAPPPRPSQTYTAHDRIDQNTVINYGATETNASNPFHSTNPFATDLSTSMVQPPARDDYEHDVYAASDPNSTSTNSRQNVAQQPYGWNSNATATEHQQWE